MSARVQLDRHRNNNFNKEQVISVGEVVEIKGPSFITGGSVNWYSPYGTQYGDSSKG